MIDERPLRGPGFDEANSVAVEFPAGTFYLPKPMVRRRPVFAGGRAEASRVVATDPEFNALMARVEEEDSYLAVANLAAYMLRANYPGLADDQLGDLLEYDPADESPGRWPLAVLAVAMGRTGPKAAPAT